MLLKPERKRSIKFTLGLLIMALATPVFAQEFEEVFVTGSRIALDEFSSSSPIASYDVAEINKLGVTSIDEFLKNVPAFTGYQMGSSTNNGSDQGQKKIDMRGLGFNRTLVLINGRRQVGDVTNDGAVDINTIPKAMIKRIDVLKDGASTIYGSDALAGVVNVILDDKFAGVKLTGDWGQGTENAQAPNQALSILAGGGGDTSHWVISAEYNKQDVMYQSEKGFATEALFPILQSDGTFKAIGSGSSNSRKILVPGAGNFIFDEALNQARSFESGDVYNYAPANALITPNERYQFGLLGNIDISEQMTAYVEANYTKRQSFQRLAPDASFATALVTTPNYGEQWNDFVPAANPYNPFGINAAGIDGLLGTADDLNNLGIENTDVRINRRFVESGGRQYQQNAKNYRLVFGLEGAFNELNWDFSYIHAASDTSDTTLNMGRFDRWAVAVDPAACAADESCPTVLNPFGDYGSITPEQMTFLSADSIVASYSNKLDLIALNISGDLVKYRGNTIAWAAGYEHRKESGKYLPSDFLALGLTTDGANAPLTGQFSVNEYYGELYIPATDHLTLNASLRYSDYYTSAGDELTFKLGGDLQMSSDLRLRVSYSTGFRAPNIAELNQTAKTSFPITESLCEFGDRRLASGDLSQTAYDNCVALGIDTSDAGELGFAWESLYEESSTGELKPEKSETYTAGFVWEPAALPGLQLSSDYWHITVDNVIASPDINDLLQTCLDSPNLSAAACDGFDGWNGQPTGEPYPISDYTDGFPYPSDYFGTFGNLGKISTDGFDIDALFVGEISASVLQSYAINWSAVWQRSYDETFALTGSRSRIGTADGFAVFPKWRYNLSLGLNGNDWSVNWRITYIGQTTDRLRSAVVAADAVAEAIYYHDIVGTYSWQNVDVMVGINNATDENPPYFHSAFNANTEPGMYDVIGRRLFTSISIAF